MISPAAVENTRVLIEAHAQQHTEMAPIVLRDVRTIPKVTQHPKVFSEWVPVYFRVDLLRPIIAMHILSNHETNCFVYGDLDMEPLSQEQLFDQDTVYKLERHGFVLAGYRCLVENGFQMISNSNRLLFEAMEWVLVELNIQRAYNALQGRFGSHIEDSCPMACLQEAVFSSYRDMFCYFCVWRALEQYMYPIRGMLFTKRANMV